MGKGSVRPTKSWAIRQGGRGGGKNQQKQEYQGGLLFGCAMRHTSVRVKLAEEGAGAGGEFESMYKLWCCARQYLIFDLGLIQNYTNVVNINTYSTSTECHQHFWTATAGIPCVLLLAPLPLPARPPPPRRSPELTRYVFRVSGGPIQPPKPSPPQ